MFLHYEKGRARRHMIEVMHKAKHEHISEFAFNMYEYESLHWEHDSEFTLKGEMYDVIKKEFRNDSVFMQCIHDKKETSINKSIVKFIAGFLSENPLHDKQMIALSEFVKQLAPIMFIRPTIISTFTEMIEMNKMTHLPHNGFSDPSIPPPKYS